MRICIVSDSHDNIPLLCAAVANAVDRGAEAVLHCGDIVAPSTLARLHSYHVPVHAIHGNNSGDLYILSKLAQNGGNLIQYHGQDAELELGGRRIFMVHYPHYAEAMAMTGKYDLVCCGHSHKPLIESIRNINNADTLLVNPGTVGGVAGKPPTYVLGDLTTLRFTLEDVPKNTEETLFC